MAKLRPGDAAPPFDAPTQDPDHPYRWQEHVGRWRILFFYPKDGTYNCTREACSFRDNGPKFRSSDAELVGISRDSPERHQEFARQRRLTYPLVSDPRGDIARRYGALTWYGWPRRSTFIVDPQGKVAFVFPRVRAKRHAETVLARLTELQASADAERKKRGVPRPAL